MYHFLSRFLPSSVSLLVPVPLVALITRFPDNPTNNTTKRNSVAAVGDDDRGEARHGYQDHVGWNLITRSHGSDDYRQEMEGILSFRDPTAPRAADA